MVEDVSGYHIEYSKWHYNEKHGMSERFTFHAHCRTVDEKRRLIYKIVQIWDLNEGDWKCEPVEEMEEWEIRKYILLEDVEKPSELEPDDPLPF